MSYIQEQAGLEPALQAKANRHSIGFRAFLPKPCMRVVLAAVQEDFEGQPGEAGWSGAEVEAGGPESAQKETANRYSISFHAFHPKPCKREALAKVHAESEGRKVGSWPVWR